MHPEGTGTGRFCSAVLMVGGTGMLAGCAVELARRGSVVGVVARGRERLDALSDAAADLPGRIEPIVADYLDLPSFRDAVWDFVAENAPVGCAIAWIHGSSPDPALAVAEALLRHARDARYMDIIGSLRTHPELVSRGRRALFLPLEYQAVLLGYAEDEDGPRWLTDEEISAGVLRALDGPALDHVVGRLDPWDGRPG